ncbi:hypothetical protein ACFL0L_00795 [Patescibacteria group bacterium]
MIGMERMGSAFREMISGRGSKKEQEPEVHVDELHSQFLNGAIGQRELFAALPPDKVEEFIQHHKSVASTIDTSQNRQLFFRLNQLNNLIDKGGFEKGVNGAHGVNVVERWN